MDSGKKLSWEGHQLGYSRERPNLKREKEKEKTDLNKHEGHRCVREKCEVREMTQPQRSSPPNTELLLHSTVSTFICIPSRVPSQGYIGLHNGKQKQEDPLGLQADERI